MIGRFCGWCGGLLHRLAQDAGGDVVWYCPHCDRCAELPATCPRCDAASTANITGGL